MAKFPGTSNYGKMVPPLSLRSIEGAVSLKENES